MHIWPAAGSSNTSRLHIPKAPLLEMMQILLLRYSLHVLRKESLALNINDRYVHTCMCSMHAATQQDTDAMAVSNQIMVRSKHRRSLHVHVRCNSQDPLFVLPDCQCCECCLLVLVRMHAHIQLKCLIYGVCCPIAYQCSSAIKHRFLCFC